VQQCGGRRSYVLCPLILPEEALSIGSGVPREGLGSSNPPEIPKALQNRVKLNPVVKTVKDC